MTYGGIGCVDCVLESTNAHLSLEAVHRRGWGSLDAALTEGRVDSTAPRTLLAQIRSMREPLTAGLITPNSLRKHDS